MRRSTVLSLPLQLVFLRVETQRGLGFNSVGSSLARKYYIRAEVTDSDKHSSLFQYGCWRLPKVYLKNVSVLFVCKTFLQIVFFVILKQ